MLISDLEIVIKTAEFGSITAASENLDIQVARASAAIKRVEKQIGFELFIRSTRKLRLSVAGENYIPQCIQALEILNNAQQEEMINQGAISGELRLTSSSDLGRNILMPWLDDLVTQHSQLKLKLVLSDQPLDFYRDSVDIALRYGSPSDSNMYGFKICDVPRVLCASPSYLDKHALPVHPKDIADHNALCYQMNGVVHDTWKFTNKKKTYSIKVKGNRVSNDGDLVRKWCVAGKGLAFKSILDISNDLLNRNIISIIPEYKPAPTELWLICPSKQSINPLVRLLRDEITNNCHNLLKKLKDKGHIL